MRRGLDQMRERVDYTKYPVDVPDLLTRLGVSHWEEKKTNNGTEYIHSCKLPFGTHQRGDRKPSASFNEELQVFHCWACGGGSLLWWVSNVLECSTSQAQAFLSKVISREAVEKYDRNFRELLEEIWAKEQETVAPLPDLSESVLTQWRRPCAYLTEDREISVEVQEEMKTGVDFSSREFFEPLNQWIEQARCVVPIFFKGKLRGWLKRHMDPRQLGPKYLNSYGLNRRRILYNFDNALEYERVIVVEAPLTVLRLMSLGHRNVVASFGSEISPEQLILLRKWEKIDFWMDRDPPGQFSEKTNLEELQKFAFVRRIPHLYDLDIETLTGEQVLECMSEAYL